MINKFLQASIITCLMLPSYVHAKDDIEKRFKVIENKDASLCNDIAGMLNDKSNVKYTTIHKPGQRSAGTDFNIPDNYKSKYTRPEWQDVPESKFTYEYFYKDIVDRAQEYKKQTGNFDVQSATFNFDGERKYLGDATVYRMFYSNSISPKKCFVSAAQSARTRLNGSPYSNGCNFLIVGGEGYLSYRDFQNQTINIVRPELVSKIDEEGWGYNLLVFQRKCKIKESR